MARSTAAEENERLRYIDGSQLKDCDTWYDVYQKLLQPPYSIPPERLEKIEQLYTDLRCTGCMRKNVKVTVVVDTENKLAIPLSDYNNEPPMKAIYEWKIKGYEMFCPACKDDHDLISSIDKNIKSLERKEIPEKWAEPELLCLAKLSNNLKQCIRIESNHTYLPKIERGLIEEKRSNTGRYFAFVDYSYVNTPSYFRKLKGNALQHLDSFSEDYIEFKRNVNRYGMWALVDKNWTALLADKIREYGIHSCLEVGAGSGWLTKALSEHGISVMATDMSPDENEVTPVKALSADKAIECYPEMDALIISWPYGNAGLMIRNWPVGKWVIYIGEASGGLNADDDFFDQIDFESYSEVPMPRWEWVGDFCRIGKKVKERPDSDSE